MDSKKGEIVQIVENPKIKLKMVISQYDSIDCPDVVDIEISDEIEMEKESVIK